MKKKVLALLFIILPILSYSQEGEYTILGSVHSLNMANFKFLDEDLGVINGFVKSGNGKAVADAMIIDRLVDLTIYVIRHGNLDRNQLGDIEQLYQSKRLHNMCVVFNGVAYTRHGYGYSYVYLGDEDKSMLHRFIDKLKKLFAKR